MSFELELGVFIISSFLLINSQIYKVPPVSFEVYDNDFSVNIPDENGMQTVLYKIIINDKCPTLLDSLFEPIDNKWISKFTGYKLNKGDELKVNIMVEFNDEIHQNFELRKVNDQGKVQIETEIPTPSADDGANICRPTATTSTKTSVQCSGDVIFEENFDGNMLNFSVWTHEIRSRIQARHPELVAYDNEKRNCYVKDGKLYIRATWNQKKKKKKFDVSDRCTSIIEEANDRLRECNYTYPGNFKMAYPPIMSAKIHTGDSFSFKYGKVEVRAKLPIGDFLFPYIILQPKSKKSENLYANYTRIAYSRGNKLLETMCKKQIGGRYLYGDIVYWENGNTAYEQIERNERLDEHYGEKFHTYAVTWKKNALIFELDGDIYGIIRTTHIKPFNDEEFYIIIGVTVGGIFNFPKDINHELSNAMCSSTLTEVKKFHAAQDSINKTWSHPKLVIDYIRVTAINE